MASAVSTPPLTTLFNPPSTCIPFTDAGISLNGHYYHEFNPDDLTGSWTSCYPPHFTDAWTINPHLTPSYYSPGICPSAYTICDSVCISGYVEFWGLSSSSETGGRCCLSGWSTYPVAEYCVNTISETVVTAPGINIRWKSSDLSLYDPKSPGMARATAIAAATTTAPPTPSIVVSTVYATKSANASSSSSAAHGLSTAGKISIGVVIPVLALLTAMIVYFFVRNRKKLRNTSSGTDYSTHNAKPEVIEMDSTLNPKHEAIEMDSTLNPKHEAIEMDSTFDNGQPRHHHGIHQDDSELSSQRAYPAELEVRR